VAESHLNSPPDFIPGLFPCRRTIDRAMRLQRRDDNYCGEIARRNKSGSGKRGARRQSARWDRIAGICRRVCDRRTACVLLTYLRIQRHTNLGRVRSVAVELVSLLLRPGMGTKYCYRRVCLFVCWLAYFKNNMLKVYKIFCTGYPCSWLGPSLTTMQYDMYFRFCG